MGKGKKKNGKKNANYKPIKDDSDTDHTSRRRSTRKKKINGVAMATDDYQLRQHIEGDGSRTIIDIAADGNCLFGSLSDQLYYDYGRNHAEIRHQVCNFMEEHKDDFVVFLVLDDEDATDDEEDAPDFDSYIDSMRRPCEWGGHLELVAAARLYRRNIRVFSMNLDILTIEHGSNKKASGPDLQLSYHDSDHYNSVRLSNATKPSRPIKMYFGGSLPNEEEAPSMDMDEEETTTTTVDGHVTTSSVISDELTATTVEVPNQPLQESIEASVRTHHSSATQPNRPRKNQPCPCGSNLRFKKCCLAKEKHQARLQLKQQCSSQSTVEDDNNNNEPAMDGNFRVLRI